MKRKWVILFFGIILGIHNVSMEEETIKSKSMEVEVKSFSIPTYRFVFSSEFYNELLIFCKIHEQEDRKEFKKSWNNWCDNNCELIEREMNNLCKKNYKGDIKKKMYTSARFYFRKKKENEKEKEIQKLYIKINKKLIVLMREHIEMSIKSNNFSQKDCFSDFYENNSELIGENIIQERKDGEDIIQEIKNEENTEKKRLFINKLKKSYKNIYFKIKKTINEND